jgi:hypothetical protein
MWNVSIKQYFNVKDLGHVTLWRWGSSSRRFVSTTNFRNIGTRRRIPGDLNLQQHRCEKLRYSKIIFCIIFSWRVTSSLRTGSNRWPTVWNTLLWSICLIGFLVTCGERKPEDCGGIWREGRLTDCTEPVKVYHGDCCVCLNSWQMRIFVTGKWVLPVTISRLSVNRTGAWILILNLGLNSESLWRFCIFRRWCYIQAQNVNYESTKAGKWTECMLCFIACTRVQTAECKE